MGHAMTTTARPARRERLKLVVAEPAEADMIERILRKRLRERRERRGAMARRQVHHTEEEKWIDIAGALRIQDTDNPADLLAALASGKVQHRFVHPSRWWVWKAVPPRLWKEVAISGNKLIGPNGSSLENEHQELRINERHLREYLGKPAAPAPSPEVSPPAAEKVRLRDATDDEIRVAMRTIYDERADERPNTKKIVSPVRDWLKSKGLYATRDRIGDIAGEEEFKNRRDPPGRTRRTRQAK